MTYVKIRSWHLVFSSPTIGTWRTRCGRTVTIREHVYTTHGFPLDEKSCETCLRLAANDG